MGQKILKTATITPPGGTDYKLISATPPGGWEKEEVENTVLDDDIRQFFGDPQPRLTAMSFSVANEGTGAPQETHGDFVFAFVYIDGSGETTDTKTVNGFLSSVEANEVGVGTDRRAVWNCTFTPSGSEGAEEPITSD